MEGKGSGVYGEETRASRGNVKLLSRFTGTFLKYTKQILYINSLK